MNKDTKDDDGDDSSAGSPPPIPDDELESEADGRLELPSPEPEMPDNSGTEVRAQPMLAPEGRATSFKPDDQVPAGPAAPARPEATVPAPVKAPPSLESPPSPTVAFEPPSSSVVESFHDDVEKPPGSSGSVQPVPVVEANSGPTSKPEASPPAAAPAAPPLEDDDSQIIIDRAKAIRLAKKHWEGKRAVVPHKDLPAYVQLEGKPYPLSVPTFSDYVPNLSDLGIGISHYFELLRVMKWLLLAMFLLGTPSLIFTFVADPTAVETAQKTGGALGALKVFTVSAMFKSSTASAYGCDTGATANGICKLGTGDTLPTATAASIVVYLDLAYSLLFLLVAVPALRSYFESRARAVDDGATSAADFTVAVWGIPQDATAEELTAHFDQFAKAPEAPEAQAPAPAPAAVPAPSTEEVAAANPGAVEGDDGQGQGEQQTSARKAAWAEEDEIVPAGKQDEDGSVKDSLDGVEAVYIARRDRMVLYELRKLAAQQDELDDIRVALRRAASGSSKKVSSADIWAPEGTGESAIKAADAQAKNSSRAQTRAAKVEAAIERRAEVIQRLRSGGAQRAVCAFVVLRSQAARDECVRRFASSASREYSLKCWGQRPEYRLRGRHQLKVSVAPEPDDVLWENLECSAVERAGRRLLSALVSLLIILISLAVIVWGKTYAQQLTNAQSGCKDVAYALRCNAAIAWNASVSVGCPVGRRSPCNLSQVWGAADLPLGDGMRFPLGPLPVPLVVNTSVRPVASIVLNGASCRYSAELARANGSNFSSAGWLSPDIISQTCIKSAVVTTDQWTALTTAGWAAGGAFSNSSTCTACYCSALMSANPAAWWDSLDVWPKRGGIRTRSGEAPCSAQALSLATFTGLQVAAILLVVVFNALMAATVDWLARFERHHTVADLEAAVAFGVFAGQFINTFLVALLVYAQIDTIKSDINNKLGGLSSIFPLFAGPFADFTDQWFALVGAQLVMTVVVNVVMPLVPLVLALFSSCCCLPLAARSATTQRALNRAYTGGEFGLAARYGSVINTIFGCLMLSSGVPVLLLVAALTLSITSWIDRLFLLRLCRLPPNYSGKLNRSGLEYLPYALLAHMLIGCWIYSALDSSGTPLFPRPTAITGGLVAAAQAFFASTGNCYRQVTQADCRAAGQGICVWTASATVSDGGGSCTVSSAAGGPLAAVPRLFNDLTFPYLVGTGLVAALVFLRWTPLWPILTAVCAPAAACIARPFAAAWRELSGGNYRVSPDEMSRADAAVAAAKARAQSRPSYTRAVREGMFGNFPKTYDLTEIHPYDEVLSRKMNKNLFAGRLAEFSSLGPEDPAFAEAGAAPAADGGNAGPGAADVELGNDKPQQQQ